MADSSHSSPDSSADLLAAVSHSASEDASLSASTLSNVSDPSHSQDDIQPQILAQYELAFRAAIARHVPISDGDRQTLENLQRTLTLSDDQVRQIGQTIKAEVEQDARRYQEKIRQYERQFAALAGEEGQLSSAERSILQALQKRLELRAIDVQTLENYIVAQRLAKSAAATRLENSPPSAVGDLTESPSERSVSSTQQPDDYRDAKLSVPMANGSMSDGSMSDGTEADPAPLPVFPTQEEQSPSFEVIESSPTPADFVADPVSDLVSDPVTDQAPSQHSDQPDQPEQQHSEQQHSEQQHSEQQQAQSFADAQSDTHPEVFLKTELESSTSVSKLLSSPDLTVEYNQLETYLKNQDWQKADEETFTILKKATAELVSWIDPQAIRKLPCRDLNALDDLWYRYSDNKFGFRVQHQIFEATQVNGNRVTRFGQAVGWTLFQRQFFGFKYYQQLTFDLKEAPPGHLPAKWFWELPLWESLRSGGLGNGRGGCGDDVAGMLFAMMYQFVRCGGGDR